MITLGNYEYNPNHANLLGSGAFAFVYKGHVKNKPDEPVAIKIMKKDTNIPKNKTLLSKEISVLKDLNHENIVRLYDHGVSNNGVYLVMEFCNGGDLSEYLLAKETLPEDTIRHFLIQIGSAMDAINRKGFMHRDLKPGNILLSHCRNCGQSVVDIPGHVLTFKLEAACRLLRGDAQPNPDACALSNVGPILTNPAAYLARYPRAHRGGSPSSADYSAPSGNTGYHSPNRTSPRSFPNNDNPTVPPRVFAKPPNHPSSNRGTPIDATLPHQPRVTPQGRPSPASSPIGSHPVASSANHHDIARRIQPKSLEPDTFSPLIHQERLVPGAPVGRLQDNPHFRGDVADVTICPGEYQHTTGDTRRRPQSGTGTMDQGLNAPHVLAAVGMWAANEFCDEQLMDPEHNEEIKTITMVLELCELLTELAERRASVLADCTVTTSSTTSAHDMNSEVTPDVVETSTSSHGAVCKPVHTSSQESGGVDGSSPRPTGLRFLSEAQRIVEQIVLYRRVLYYLEYVYVQVKKAVVRRRLKSTATSRRRLNDCNSLYHRCYIRLRQLARQSRRDDLIEPVGRLLANITANRLIFQYALVQCQAAEMDDYVGDIAQSLQRYKAGITLLHGLRQHAKSARDKTVLAECMRLLHDRYNALRAAAAKTHQVGYFGVTAPLGALGSIPLSGRSPTPLAAESSNLITPGAENPTMRQESGPVPSVPYPSSPMR
ncbi:unnamed protein product [Dicrocoelium dendriticum]|nr:unnamed protein product [Dicrocoelium dendriticum]